MPLYPILKANSEPLNQILLNAVDESENTPLITEVATRSLEEGSVAKPKPLQAYRAKICGALIGGAMALGVMAIITLVVLVTSPSAAEQKQELQNLQNQRQKMCDSITLFNNDFNEALTGLAESDFSYFLESNIKSLPLEDSIRLFSNSLRYFQTDLSGKYFPDCFSKEYNWNHISPPTDAFCFLFPGYSNVLGCKIKPIYITVLTEISSKAETPLDEDEIKEYFKQFMSNTTQTYAQLYSSTFSQIDEQCRIRLNTINATTILDPARCDTSSYSVMAAYYNDVYENIKNYDS